MKKNMYSVLLHFFLFVCLVIPLHTTANAANTTDDCLQILASDFAGNSAKEFIGTQHLNITDSQYQTIRTFTLDLTEKYSSTKDKITAIYQWARDTSLKASVGEDAPADLEENDPYKVFKEKTGVCQGKANLCKTMLAAIDVPCIIAHGYWETEGHAWDFVLCDGKWGIVDASMWQISLDDPSDISSHYKTDSLEAVLYEKDGFEFTYYLGGIGAVGYTGNAERLEIPESCNGYPVISIAAESQIYYEHSFQDTAAKELVLPATVKYGIYLSDYEIRSFYSKSLESISVDENNPVFASYDGILYSKDYSRIYSVPAGISEVTLKPIEILEKNTLTNLSNLRILKIGEGTKELEEDAIENCEHLEKVYIPDSVTTIAYEESNGNVYEAFSGCPNNFVVYASAGSAGEAYAKKKGLTCKDPKELFPADYSKIDELLKTVPDDSDLYRYTPDSVSRLKEAIQAINRDCTAAQQNLVDEMAKNLETAIKKLEVRPTVPDTNETEKPQPDTETPETHVPDQSGNTETPKPAAKPTAPAKVTGVKISYKKSGKTILGWKKVKNASGYEIYRYQNKRCVKVKKVGKKTSFVIKKRSRKTVYYRVRAFRKKGKNVSYGKYSRKVKCKSLQKAK